MSACPADMCRIPHDQCSVTFFWWVARPESSKGVECLQILHALLKASGRATLNTACDIPLACYLYLNNPGKDVGLLSYFEKDLERQGNDADYRESKRSLRFAPVKHQAGAKRQAKLRIGLRFAP